MHHSWISRAVTVAVSTVFIAATCAVTPTPAEAAAGTTVRINTPTTIIIGTKSPIGFTVSGTLSTADPAHTDIDWSLEGSSAQCFMFYDGDTEGTASSTYADHSFVTPSDLGNACAGSAVLEVDAFDNTSFETDKVQRSVKILRAARWESFNAHPEPIHKGGSLHIDGTLQRANWDDSTYHRYTQHTAELQFRTMTGSYATVRTVASATGNFTATETEKVSGCWRYVFPGSSTTGPATSPGDCVAIS